MWSDRIDFMFSKIYFYFFENFKLLRTSLLPLFATLWTHFAPKFTFLLNFQKLYPKRSQVRRTTLIRSALESPDLCVFNDG